MNKWIFMIVLWLLIPRSGYGCDVCAGLNQSGATLFPQYNSSILGIIYQYQGMQIRERINNNDRNQRTDNYNKISLLGAWNIGDRFRIAATLPYSYKTSTGGVDGMTFQGIGDISVNGNYKLYDDSIGNAALTLYTGVGVLAPAGRYQIRDNRGILQRGLQPGSGAWSYLANITCLLKHNSWVNQTIILSGISGTNSFDYKSGSSVTLDQIWFYESNILKQKTWLGAGFYLNHAARDMEFATYRLLNQNSGGTDIFASVAGNCFFKRFGFSFSYRHCIYTSYSKWGTRLKPNLQVGFSSLF